MNNLSGWLVIDKPAGVNSTRVVSIVRKLLGTRKVGHAGTLDPFASGILPIAVGEATKTVAYAQDGRKEYDFTVVFGESRDTDDIDGVVTATSSVVPDTQAITAVLPEFTGIIYQAPPRYSAIKIEGKRSYDLARQGSQHEMVARQVVVYRLELLASEGREAKLRMQCGKGTYVRSIARDIAVRLGSCAYVSQLRRTQVGNFLLPHAILLDNLNEMVHNRPPSEYLLPIDTVLDDIPVVTVSTAAMQQIYHGQAIPAEKPILNADVIRIVAEGKLIALGRFQEEYIKPMRVFNI